MTLEELKILVKETDTGSYKWAVIRQESKQVSELYYLKDNKIHRIDLRKVQIEEDV